MTSRSPTFSGHRAIIWSVAIAIVAGFAMALLWLPRFPHPDDRAAPPPTVTLLGQPLPLNETTNQVALGKVRRFAAAPFSLVLPEQRVAELSLGRLGAQINKVRLSALLRDAKDPTSLLRQTHSRRAKAGAPLVLPLPIVLEPSQGFLELMRIKDQVDRVPVDARMDLESRQLLAEVSGYLLDVDATWLRIADAVTRGERRAEAVVETLRPHRVRADLGNVEFGSILGSFETRYDRSDKSRDRTFNLRLAASKLDGHVLLAGEEFDFNGIVGPRDEASGYKVATVIAEGELVDGVGGGTCQISGTLHGAVFFAGLEIVERIPHTRPSGYIKMGLDATVVYPTINFRFKNPFDFPIVIHETVKNGTVRAEILGPKLELFVTLIRRITDVLPYEQLERPDDKLPKNTRILAQRGVAGFSVTRYRIVRRGAYAVRERWLDKYPPTPQIVRVGTGDSGSSTRLLPQDDAHPEYLADELLVLTQSTVPLQTAGSDDPKDAVSEWREPGTTGKAGWTKEAKMPQFESKSNETEAATDKKPLRSSSPKPQDLRARANSRP
jgi:vancomycin resistance protein YoaR